MLKKPNIRKELARRRAVLEAQSIMTAQERDLLRSQIARDKKTPRPLKLRAVMDLDRVWRMRHGAGGSGVTWADVLEKATAES
jgi:hypothetical protein